MDGHQLHLASSPAFAWLSPASAWLEKGTKSADLSYPRFPLESSSNPSWLRKAAADEVNSSKFSKRSAPFSSAS